MKSKILIAFLFVVVLFSALPVFAQDKPLTLFGYDFKCYPELPVVNPADPSRHGCGFADAFGFAEYAFELLMRGVVIPLAALMIIWGGYYILTAGSSPDRVKKGKKIMLSAIIGIIIALAAPLLVSLIYQIILGIDPPTNP